MTHPDRTHSEDAPLPARNGAAHRDDTMPTRTGRLLAAVLVLYGLALALPWLGASPLSSHEALVGARTRGLMTLGRWVVPWVTTYTPDVRKPPLPFWTGGVLALAVGEINEWTIRLPSVAATLATMLLLVAWVRRAAHWRAALVTGLVFLTCGGALVWGRRGEVDMQLCFWTTAALVAYWFGVNERVRRRQVVMFLAMWLALGLSILAKGPLPVGIWAVTVAGHTIFDRQWRQWRQMLPVVGPLVVAVIVLPWVGAMLKVQPDAREIWFDQSLGRYGGELDHDKPWYFYLVQAPLLWMPWLVPILVGLRQALRRGVVAPTLRTFLLCWAIGGLALLSFSVGKRLFYALPCVPPVMVLAGIGLDHIVRGLPPRLSGLARWVYWAHWLVVPGAIAGAWFAAARYDDFRTPILVAGTMGAVGLAAVLVLYGVRRRVASIVTFAAVFLALFTYATATIITPMEAGGNYHARLGRALADRAADRDVVLFAEFSPEVVFYSGRSLPFVPHRDLVMDWLRDHPRAYVVAERGQRTEELAQLGTWREVPLASMTTSLMHGEDKPYVVLELTSPIPPPAVPQATDEPLPASEKPAEG